LNENCTLILENQVLNTYFIECFRQLLFARLFEEVDLRVSFKPISKADLDILPGFSPMHEVNFERE